MSARCQACGGRHATCKCPWVVSIHKNKERAREAGRFLLALVVIAILLGVVGSMDCADAQLLAQL